MAKNLYSKTFLPPLTTKNLQIWVLWLHFTPMPSTPLSVRCGVLHLTEPSLPNGWKASFDKRHINEVYLDATGLDDATIVQRAQSIKALIISEVPILGPVVVGPLPIPQKARLIGALSAQLIRATDRPYEQYCADIDR